MFVRWGQNMADACWDEISQGFFHLLVPLGRPHVFLRLFYSLCSLVCAVCGFFSIIRFSLAIPWRLARRVPPR